MTKETESGDTEIVKVTKKPKDEKIDQIVTSELRNNQSDISDGNREVPLNISVDDLQNKSKEELIDVCKQLYAHADILKQKSASNEDRLTPLQEYEKREKLRRDSSYREKILIRRLAVKEHEIQEYITQLRELKAAQIPAVSNLKSALLDPAVNIIFQKLKTDLTETKANLEETRNELNAWKFTPDSNTGKRLMAKCRLLHQENEELGKIISSGRVAKLEGELALQKNFSEEVKKSQYELDELLQDLDEDVEGMQGTIYFLQQELKKSNEIISNLQNENKKLKKLQQKVGDQATEENDGSRLEKKDTNDRSSADDAKEKTVRSKTNSEEGIKRFEKRKNDDITVDSNDTEDHSDLKKSKAEK